MSTEQGQPRDTTALPSTPPLAIEKITTTPVRIPYRRPFAISSGTTATAESLIVTVHSAGLAGHGEAAVMSPYTGETALGLQDAIDQVLAPAVIGGDATNIAGLHRRLDEALRGRRPAKAAIDIAVHDLVAQALGVPVAALLGGRTVERVPSAWVIGLGEADSPAEEARRRAAAGFGHIKVKGGHDPDQDVRTAARVRAALPDAVTLSIDLNGGYSRQVALATLPRLKAAGIDLVEQPLPGWDVTGLAELRTRCSVPVMADESLQSLHDALRLVSAGACDVLNIKVLKVGGLYRARQVAAVAAAAGVAVKIGTMPELGIGTAAAAHLAASLTDATVPADLVGPWLVESDPFAAHLMTEDGAMRVSTAPGLGIRPLSTVPHD